MSLLTIKGLDVGFGGVTVLHGIDLEIAAGSLVAIVGANGAGKTTLLRALSRLLPLRAGSIRFDGQELAGVAPHRVTRMGLVHVPQGRQIIPTLSVEENLLIGAGSLPGLGRAELDSRLAGEYDRFPVLRERRRISGGSLSGGEQQMLAVSRALMMRPRVLMLDEPSLGLAPQIITGIFGALRALAASGVTVLLVEQVAFAALKIADHGYVLQTGRIAMSGPPSELLKDPELVSRYLG
ncbi:MAG TPA: ABC transporter ATP-binding protein [Burkholderiaceae bacterium]|jgi:branched-chain amino acid transport system ATP-binding protein|nr:ABC transporter ATP-binding protein [Burkholderiaceae bacterium]